MKRGFTVIEVIVMLMIAAIVALIFLSPMMRKEMPDPAVKEQVRPALKESDTVQRTK